MEIIKSFTIDHDNHDKGFYLSYEYAGIITYDLRFKTPNGGDYLSYDAIHTIEHLFATVIRNGGLKNDVVYFGPMGCRTGFYLLLRNIEKNQALHAVIDALGQCLLLNEIPGASKVECGNYQEHNLVLAKQEISEYLNVLADIK